MKLVIATKNAGKVEEIRELLSDIPGLEVVSLLDLPPDAVPPIKETGKTFEENAYIKAYAVARATGLASLADDSGLEVDVLGGKPGVRSARFGGEGISDEERNRKLLALLENVPFEKRTARFRCCMVLVVPPEFERYTVEGVCEGYIATEPRGKHGFGYDPIFYLPSLKKTMAELPREKKNEISHRGKALRAMKDIIRKLVNG